MMDDCDVSVINGVARVQCYGGLLWTSTLHGLVRLGGLVASGVPRCEMRAESNKLRPLCNGGQWARAIADKRRKVRYMYLKVP